MKRVTLVVMSFVLGGCIAPISVSHYQSAEPVGQGNFQASGGLHIVGKDGRYGLDRDQSDGAPVSTHMRGAILLPDMQVAYGVTDRLDLHAQAFPYGGELGGRMVVVDTPNLKIAAGGAFGAWTGSRNKKSEDETVETRRTYGGYYADLPLTVSVIPVEAVSVNFGPVLTWVQARKAFTRLDNGTVTSSYVARHKAWELGFFTGLGIGNDSVRVSPGVTFYLESTKHPIENFAGDSWFAMPWLGVTLQPKKPK